MHCARGRIGPCAIALFPPARAPIALCTLIKISGLRASASRGLSAATAHSSLSSKTRRRFHQRRNKLANNARALRWCLPSLPVSVSALPAPCRAYCRNPPPKRTRTGRTAQSPKRVSRRALGAQSRPITHSRYLILMLIHAGACPTLSTHFRHAVQQVLQNQDQAGQGAEAEPQRALFCSRKDR